MRPIFLLCWVGVGIWWHVVFWIAYGGFAMDLKILTMDLRRIIRRYRDDWEADWLFCSGLSADDALLR